MSTDTTTVRLTILASQVNAANAILEIHGDSPEAEDPDADKVTLTFYDINRGDLCSSDALKNAGIAFDMEWQDGGSYDAGTEYCRFSSTGDLVEMTVSDDFINPDIHTLKRLLDQPEALRTFIELHIADTTPLPWDNQAEYGKLYQTKQLIAPTS